MEIKEISYQDRLPKNMLSKFNYFVKDFLKEYSDQLDKMDFDEGLKINKEYEADLEVYFVEFRFRKKGKVDFSLQIEQIMSCLYLVMMNFGDM